MSTKATARNSSGDPADPPQTSTDSNESLPVLPKPPPDLPELPPVPPYPCSFLTDEEIGTYVEPLYSRSWAVQPSIPHHAKKPAPELVKSFEFPSVRTLSDFLESVGWVEASENHHCAKQVQQTPPAVTVMVHTHSGLRPASYPEEPRKGRVRPGITLRDVRFAYLLEGVASESNHLSNKITPEEQPRSAEEVEARRPETGGGLP